ncbi:STAS domain-containing protein [Halobacillus litoralis]|uniref:STAS domain-containing protein n=1 Tax=Halobacillus litoralis TaxID=45668 RepID=UPI001CD53127|nr:STAS domain-containing protein [Halobacillus litoralis]MCA0969753.1 STAS domain-containing protein [Halobacillus litoralis]
MKNQVKRHNSTVQLKIPKEVTVQASTDLREQFLDCIADGYADFRLDFTNTTFLDSAGLGVIVTLKKRTNDANGTVSIEGASDSIQELFQLTRLKPSFQWR